MTKQIPLTQGKVALVDDDMYSYFMQWNYFYRNGYAAREITAQSGKRITIYMHREVMNAPDGMKVDHRNTGKTLDNRRENLRICTHAQNLQNTKKHRDNASGYKGVHLNKHAKKWQASVMSGGSRHYLGLFDDPKAAARAYDAKARELFGEFARTNF